MADSVDPSADLADGPSTTDPSVDAADDPPSTSLDGRWDVADDPPSTSLESPASPVLDEGRLCIVKVLKAEAKARMDVDDYQGALDKYDKALGFLAEARMVALGLPAEDWERTREAAESSCSPGEPWYFRILWGAMMQAHVLQDEDAAKLFSNMSLCHGRLDEWPQANGKASAALALWPEWTKARYRLTEALSHIGDQCSALMEARKARASVAQAESAEIAALQARAMSRAMAAESLSLEGLDGLTPESTSVLKVEQYQALAMLERDAFRSCSDWREGLETALFPHLFPEGENVFDMDRSQPVRFDDYVRFFKQSHSQFQEDEPWKVWAKDMSNQIREGLEKLLK